MAEVTTHVRLARRPSTCTDRPARPSRWPWSAARSYPRQRRPHSRPGRSAPTSGSPSRIFATACVTPMSGRQPSRRDPVGVDGAARGESPHPSSGAGERSAAPRGGVLVPSESAGKRLYPLVSELAADGVPAAVLKFARQPYYRWLAAPVTSGELGQAHLANTVFDAHLDDPGSGHRLLADEAAREGMVACDRSDTVGPNPRREPVHRRGPVVQVRGVGAGQHTVLAIGAFTNRKLDLHQPHNRRESGWMTWSG